MCVLVDEIRELVYERDCDRPFTVDAVELDAGSGGEQSVSVLPGRHAGRLEQVGCVVVVERIFARRVPVIQRRALEAVQAEALCDHNRTSQFPLTIRYFSESSSCTDGLSAKIPPRIVSQGTNYPCALARSERVTRTKG